jgi:cyanophycinase-like exopeptidase
VGRTVDACDVAGLLKKAQLIYLVGGSPRYLLQTLHGTAAWRLVVEQHRSGTAIVGSSAGAMVLAAKMWGGDAAWEDALGLLPGVAVLPHLERHQPERVATLCASLERGLVLLGIDSATACVNTGGSTWRALGAGRAVVYRGGRSGSYRHGQAFSLRPRRPVHGDGAQ